MSDSFEDYMRTIYSLYEDFGSDDIRSIDIANRMGVSKASVSEMIKKLQKIGYIKTKPYKKVKFTRQGLSEAKRVMHNHRVIEVFLNKVLDYDNTKVHEEAHRLEHAFSDESIRRLNNFLKKPKISPTGRQIP
jgi:DtxR family Mn-dependent transcriptional regulator